MEIYVEPFRVRLLKELKQKLIKAEENFRFHEGHWRSSKVEIEEIKKTIECLKEDAQS